VQHDVEMLLDIFFFPFSQFLMLFFCEAISKFLPVAKRSQKTLSFFFVQFKETKKIFALSLKMQEKSKPTMNIFYASMQL
jgi:hypothetical protein